MKITILTASEAKNLDLARSFEQNLAGKGVSVSIINIPALNLPLYSSKAEEEFKAHEVVGPFREKLAADGFIFLSPEYNGGVPPTLTNFIAWVSRSTKSWRETFNYKPAAIASYSAGGQNILAILRLQLSYIGMNVLGRQILTNMQKSLNEADLNAVCDELIRLAKK